MNIWSGSGIFVIAALRKEWLIWISCILFGCSHAWEGVFEVFVVMVVRKCGGDGRILFGGEK